jgi:hypothetical protein
MALWERYSSSRFLREERPVICVRRLDWMEMILRLERASRFWGVVSIWFLFLFLGVLYLVEEIQ